MKIRGLTLNGVTLEEIDRRQNLVKRYDNAFGDMAQEDRLLSGMDQIWPEGLLHDALQQGAPRPSTSRASPRASPPCSTRTASPRVACSPPA